MMVLPWGLLWYDSSEKEITEKVRGAAEAFKRKFDDIPNVCFLPLEIVGDLEQVDGVQVIGDPSVLDNHFWIGKED